jgi:hypothetical protein
VNRCSNLRKTYHFVPRVCTHETAFRLAAAFRMSSREKRLRVTPSGGGRRTSNGTRTTAISRRCSLHSVDSKASHGERQTWVAGVELAKPASPRRTPRVRGRRPAVADPSHPALLPAVERGEKT